MKKWFVVYENSGEIIEALTPGQAKAEAIRKNEKMPSQPKIKAVRPA